MQIILFFIKLLQDTKDVQKELNQLSGKLERTFNEAEEKLFAVCFLGLMRHSEFTAYYKFLIQTISLYAKNFTSCISLALLHVHRVFLN